MTRTSLISLGLCALIASLSLGCGSEGDGDVKTGPTIKRSIQRMISQADWDAVVKEEADLQSLAGGVSGTWQAAGVVEAGDGRRLHWAEYAAGAEVPRDQVVALFRACNGDGACAIGKATHTATGVALTDAKGGALDTIDMGEIVLHKELKNHNLDKSETVLRLELKRNHVVDPDLADFQAGAVPDGKRRLVLLNAYGPQVQVPLDDLRKVAESAGIFDEVRVVHFARRRDLVALLPSMSALDVLVWFGAGVLEPFSDKPAKSVGMTLSRGVFGDELIHRNHLDKLLDAPPLGGPGLVLLVGSNSLTSDHPQQTGLMAEHLHEAPHRPVVGFDGKLSHKEAEAGAVAALGALFGGKTMAEALAAGSAKSGATMTTMLTTEQAESWTMTPGKADFWEAPPKSATLKMFLKNSPKCVTLASGTKCSESGFKTGTAVPPEQLTAAHVVFDCEPSFDGPWMTCSADNAATGAVFSLRAVLTGVAVGDAILVYATGAPSKKMKGVSVIGAGRIEEASDAAGSLTLKFGGPAAASVWTDPQDHCCVAVTPLLSGNQSQLSVLTIKR